uniref:Uncharacterized protein n=1 Tax=Lates calcarifer TaxID=8187 RepID=A0A4W6BRQ4_LATCA
MTASKLIKYLLFTFNFLFFVGGIIILGLSIHVRNNKADYQITDELLPAINLLVFIGAVTLIFGFLGCCGAIQESRCLLALFFRGLLSMFLMMLGQGQRHLRYFSQDLKFTGVVEGETMLVYFFWFVCFFLAYLLLQEENVFFKKGLFPFG